MINVCGNAEISDLGEDVHDLRGSLDVVLLPSHGVTSVRPEPPEVVHKTGGEGRRSQLIALRRRCGELPPSWRQRTMSHHHLRL